MEGTLNIILDIMQFKTTEKEKDKKRTFFLASHKQRPVVETFFAKKHSSFRFPWKLSLLKSTLPSSFRKLIVAEKFDMCQ